MKSVSCDELQNMGGTLLQELCEGHSFIIMHEGRPVGSLQSLAPPVPTMTREEAIEGLKKFRAAHPLGDLDIRAMIEEGRR